MALDPGIPLAPTGPGSGGGGAGSGTGGGTRSGGGSSGGSGGSSGGGTRRLQKKGSSGAKSNDPYAQARADQRAAERRAGNRYLEQSRHLQAQADALLRALRKDYKKVLNIQLGNATRDYKAADRMLVEGYNERADMLERQVDDNVKALDQQTGINVANRARERNSAIVEATSQGAGESDIMASQLAALRNWQANQAEISRGFHDTLTSINASLVDLNVDTKTARLNAFRDAENEKESAFGNYYNRMSESYTQLGNTYGQQADYLSMAKEMKVGGGGGGKAKAAKNAFMQASKLAGKAYKTKNPARLQRWEGRELEERGTTNQSKLANAATVDLGDKRPEGATLRKW